MKNKNNKENMTAEKKTHSHTGVDVKAKTDSISNKTRASKKELLEIARRNKEDLAAIQATKSKKSKAKIIFGVVFTIAMTALVFTLIINMSDFEEMKSAVQQIGESNNWIWLLVAGIAVLTFFGLWPLTLMAFTDALGIKCKKRDMYAIGNTEHFYSYVTPSYSGGQPFQLYAMNTIGISTSKGSGAILATFTTHLIVSNIFALIALCFYGDFSAGIAQQYTQFVNGAITAEECTIKLFGNPLSPQTFGILTGVGYFLNTQTLVLTLVLGLSKRVRSWLVSIALWMSNWKWLGKFLRKRLPAFIHYLKNTQDSFKDIFAHKRAFAKGFIARFIAQAANYMIPFFLMKAIGINFTDNPGIIFIILFATSFAINTIVWLPTPGSSGGMELAFAVVISSLALMPGIIQGNAGITTGQAGVLALMWRLYTYYLILFLSLGISIYFQIRVQRNNRKEIKLLEMKARDTQEQLEEAARLEQELSQSDEDIDTVDTVECSVPIETDTK